MSTSSYLSKNGSLDSLEYFRLSTWRQREHCVSTCSSCGSSCDSPQLNECCSLTLRRRWSCLEARDVIMIVMIVFWTATLCQDHCIHHLICYLFWRRGTWSSVARDGIGQGQPSACVCVCVCVCAFLSLSVSFSSEIRPSLVLWIGGTHLEQSVGPTHVMGGFSWKCGFQELGKLYLGLL